MDDAGASRTDVGWIFRGGSNRVLDTCVGVGPEFSDAVVDLICCVCEALDTCAEVEPEFIDAVEDGWQKSLLKITGPQVLSVFDTTSI